ncbi:restriction endonuclease subunit S [Muribaculaceae bacterium Isolate-114 (HZI)]|nr:restriction endonuclease subunit S [Muribaculaceae bacterium Isolate-114 (HZI)]
MAQDKDLKTPNVPPLRFPGFTDKWKESTIGNVVKIGNGRDYKHLGNGSIPVFGTGGYMTSVDDYLYDGETVFIGRKGSIDKPFYFSGKFWTVDTLFYTYDFNGVIPKFLYSIFQRINWKKYNEASGVPSLSKATIEKIKFKYPLSPEQDKISRLLSLIDERIATQNKIIDNLQSLIKGLNDKFHEEVQGELVSFSEIGIAYSGLSGKSGDDFGQGYPFITYLNVYQNNVINEDDFGLVTIAANESQHTISHGDVLFTLSSETPDEVGIGSVYLGESDKFYLNSFCFGVSIPNKDRIYPPYLAHLVSSTKFRKFVYPLAQGSTRFNLQKNDFMKKKFILPTIEKQRRIATTLDAINAQLANEKRLKDLYIAKKEYLLRQIFI